MSDHAAREAGGHRNLPGNMRRRIATLDWSQTPLGAEPGWPQSLRSAIDIVLASRLPMLVWWGSNLTQIHNDACGPVLGQRHAWGLGRPAASCWAEAWPSMGPLAERVTIEGASTWSERLEMVVTRNGFAEEVHMTFALSPIRDDDGAIGGVLGALIEETGRVLEERRLAALGALGAATVPARTAGQACEAAAAVLAGMACDLPFALLYLLDPEQRTAHLAARTGLDAGAPASPIRVELGRENDVWRFADALRRGRMATVDDLALAPASMPSATEPEPPRQAVVLPLPRPGGMGLAGFLVAGLSPRLVFDDAYRTFLDRLSRQVATAIAAAQVFEEERRRAEALVALDRAKSAFVAKVGHEFRTALTLMLGPLEELLGRADVAEAARERLATVHRNGQRLLRLVDTLRDVGRVETGRAVPRLEPTDLSALTADLAAVFGPACEEAGLLLTVACPPLGGPVRVDRAMWEQIVLNLLFNAFKHTVTGGIMVRVAREGDHVVLTVADTGVGIPEVAQPRLFDRFDRMEGSGARSREGPGFGLAEVRELAHLHRGEVGVNSAPGQGATFTVRLPLGVQPSVAAMGAGHRVPITERADAFVRESRRWLPGRVPASLGGLARDASPDGARVLVAADDAAMRDSLRRLLEAHYRVEVAADGAEALARIEADPPDLVISDVMMPHLDGFGLLRAIRARPRLAGLPVILLSARASEDPRLEGLDHGADDFLVEPFGGRELMARVAINLKVARLRRHANEAVRASVALTEASTDVLYRMSPDWSEMRQLAGAGFLGDATEPNPDWLTAYIPESDRDRVTGAVAAAVEAGRVFELEHRVVRADGSVGWTLSRAVPSRDAAGEVVEWFGSDSDISARKAAEEKLRRSDAQLRAMVAELQHRTRNLLTIVSAVAEQTAATSRSADDFNRRFNQRLAALGRVQGLLSRGDAPDITLRSLVELELDAHGVEHGVHLRGPEVVLPAATVQLLALALHELTTNALKHGALGHGSRLDVSWSREGGKVEVIWTESGGPGAAAVGKPGFGLQLIRWMLPYELDAQTSLTFAPDGLRCSLRMKIDDEPTPPAPADDPRATA